MLSNKPIMSAILFKLTKLTAWYYFSCYSHACFYHLHKQPYFIYFGTNSFALTYTNYEIPSVQQRSITHAGKKSI